MSKQALEMQITFNSVSEAVAAIRSGGMIVVVDAKDREHEGDLIMAAEMATPEALNFITGMGRGLVCAPMTTERLQKLKLAQMVNSNTARLGTRFTVSVDLLEGTTTGISCADRTLTLKALADPAASADDFGRPGHIFPLEAAAGGLAERPGHTEATVELCRLAGLAPVGILCEILSEDGSMARTAELLKLSRDWNLPMIRVSDVQSYLQSHSEEELQVERDKIGTEQASLKEVTQADLPTRYGMFRLHVFNSDTDGKDHLALTKGDLAATDMSAPLVRIHSQCLTGDTLGSIRCDCGSQLALAMERIEQEGRGILLYMRQEGRGIGLANKIKAYALQDEGYDTVEANLKLGFGADLRDYSVSARMLKALGVNSVRLMTNNPAKVAGLVANGITVVSRDSAETAVTCHNRNYLKTKRDKLGHLFEEIERCTG